MKIEKNIDNIIPIGQKIMVYVTEGNFKGTYSSFIYDLDNNSILIFMPTNENGLKAILRPKDRIQISFVAKNGDRFGFGAVIQNTKKEDGKILYQIGKPNKITKTELRDNFRVQVLIDAEFYYFKDGKIQQGEGTIIDISAGGAKLSCESEFTVRDKLSLKFVLGEYLVSGQEAEVARIALANEDGIRHYGLRFTNMEKETENRIIKFCLNKQMEMIRKERGME